MLRPSAPRLLWLFARTAARRFCNRFLLGWQRSRLARWKKRGLPAPEPERMATGHRHQKFRAGTLLVVLFAAYMMFVMAMAMELSVRRAMNGVRLEREPAAQTLEDRESIAVMEKLTRNNPAALGLQQDPFKHMTPATRRTAERAGALLMLIAGAGSLLFAIGMASRNLARPEPSLAWLFEFPVPRPVLFGSRLCESLFDGATLPLLSIVPGILLWYSGRGFWDATGWGIMFGILMSLAVGALRIAMEVLMLQKMPRRRRGTVGGLCAAAGTLMMVIVLYGGGTPVLQRTLLAGAEGLPAWFFLNPLSGGFGSGITGTGGQWLRATLPVMALCTGSVLLCARLTRFGLEPGLETARTGTPAEQAASGEKRQRFTGLIGKELLMLTRQRTVMVQVLLAPFIMVLMFYFQSGGRLAERTLSSAGTMSAAVYGISAYMVLIAAQVAMNTELRTLWLLLSLPRPLAEALRVKSRIWGAAAALLVLALCAAAIFAQPQMAPGLLLRLPFMIVLVWLIADLTVGIRTSGSCVLSETTVQVRQWANWMPLLLSAGAGQAVFEGNVWMLTVQVVLLGALNVSIWQKLNADLPYLTEPAEDPPARLCTMHGQFAVYGYFALQTLAIATAVLAKVPIAVALPAGAAAAALVVAGVSILSLKRRGISILPEPAPASLQNSLLFAGALAVTCGAGFLWLKSASFFPWAAEALASGLDQFSGENQAALRTGIAVLAIIVAPVCEEFLFRGIVYQGLRKTAGVTASVLWSALFFTVVHPPVSAPAVFVAAVALALVMEHTRRLTACILVHAGYNAFMLWLQWG